MALNDFKNIENINLNLESQAQLVDSKDLAIFKTTAKTVNDFGISKNDVIEFRIYDISNNLLQQKNGESVKYIYKNNFPFYLKEILDSNAEKVLTFDVEKLVKEAGYLNGEFKIVFSFVKNFLGTNNKKQRVWIHEISPSRTEIRVLPLITTDVQQNIFIEQRYNAFMDNASEFNDYYTKIKQTLDSLELTISDIIENYFLATFGKNWIDTIKKDFFSSKEEIYNNIKKKIFLDFKNSVYYFFEGKEYDLNNPNYGKKIKEANDLYEFLGTDSINNLLSNRLTESIEYNIRQFKLISENQKLTIETNVKPSDDLKELLGTSYTTTSNLTQKDKIEVINKPISQPIIVEEKEEEIVVIKKEDPILRNPEIEYGEPIKTDVEEEPQIEQPIIGDPPQTNIEEEPRPASDPIGGGPGRTITYVNEDGEQETKTINLTYIN